MIQKEKKTTTFVSNGRVLADDNMVEFLDRLMLTDRTRSVEDVMLARIREIVHLWSQKGTVTFIFSEGDVIEAHVRRNRRGDRTTTYSSGARPDIQTALYLLLRMLETEVGLESARVDAHDTIRPPAIRHLPGTLVRHFSGRQGVVAEPNPDDIVDMLPIIVGSERQYWHPDAVQSMEGLIP